MEEISEKKIPSMPYDSPENASPDLCLQKFGIWDFWTVRQSRFDWRSQWKEIVSAYQLIKRFWIDIVSLSFRLALLYILFELWEGLESAILMYIQSSLLQTIEAGLRDGLIDEFRVQLILGSRLVCMMFVAWVGWLSEDTVPRLKRRIIQLYDIRLMEARVQTDLRSSQEPIHNFQVSTSDAWDAFEAVVYMASAALNFISQLAVIAHISRATGGPVLTLLCLSKPFLRVILRRSLWSQTFLVYLSNKNYRSMVALEAMTRDQYKQDYLTANLGPHVIKEYIKEKNALGDVCTDNFWEQYGREKTPFFPMAMTIFDELPMFYCIAKAIENPKGASIASFIIVLQSTGSLQQTFRYILYRTTSFKEVFVKMKNLYSVFDAKTTVREGNLVYSESNGLSHADGMGFELRNITFNYPGSDGDASAALVDVSLVIDPGSVVVIVGENGSGKSTIVKLLTRLYEPSSGDLFIDSEPAHDYQLMSVLDSMAIFTQDSNLFPLSLYDNIALGDPENRGDREKVAKAAELGGAKALLEKLGEDLVLTPKHNVWMLNVPDDKDHPLQKQKALLSKERSVSGGEKQRIVASRMFMRMESRKVTFVAVDEPSSAMDAEAELELFKQLLMRRSGKTMVFVTHRFGHLTKHANLIVCMKEGKIVESGSHKTLMAKDGEYANLYKIQANAFDSKSDNDNELTSKWDL